MINDNITRYQKLPHLKQARKGAIHDHYENIIVPVPSLQNKFSAVIEYTIHCIYKSITSSNDTNVSEMSAFSSASNITTESNSRSVSNGSLNFGIDGNSQNKLLPTRPGLVLP